MWGCVCACMHVWEEGGVVWLFAGILDIRIFVIWSFSPQQASSACSLYPSHWEKKGGNDNKCEYKAREQECAWRWFVITTPWFCACVRARRFQFCLVRQRQDKKRSKVELSSLRVEMSSYDKRRRWGANQPLGEGEKKKKKAYAPQSLAVAGSLNRCQLSSPLCINERKCCGGPKKTPREPASVFVLATCQRAEGSKYITQTESCKIQVCFIYLHVLVTSCDNLTFQKKSLMIDPSC